MKSILNLPKPLFFILGMLVSISLDAQNDVVLRTNGEEMHGKVTKMNADDIQFIYQNETVEYTVSKADIVKITFSSGRIEFFNNRNSSIKPNLEDHHNKVAILPFGYIRDQETSNAEMTKKIQQETYSIFKKKAITLQFQDPTTTNALLAKAGLNNNNIEGYTMGEICNILGVEYAIQGLVSVEKSSVTDYSSTSTKYRNDNNKLRADRKGNLIGDLWNSNKGSSRSSTFSTSTQNYATNITMNVYTDKGENIYNRDHQAFWQNQDAYKITLSFLAKRTPLFKR